MSKAKLIPRANPVPVGEEVYFKFVYTDPATQTEYQTFRYIENGKELTALECAYDLGYSLSDKGQFSVYQFVTVVRDGVKSGEWLWVLGSGSTVKGWLSS